MSRVTGFTGFMEANGELQATAHSIVRLLLKLPLHLHVETTLDWRRGRVMKHAALALTGRVHLPELSVEVVFRRRRQGEAGVGDEQYATAVVVPPEFAMAVPLQFLPMPRPEESDVWALTSDPARERPWVEHYVGDRGEELLTFDQHVPVLATLDARFKPEECQEGRGAKVELEGELRFEQTSRMRLMFRDPSLPAAPPSESDSDEVILIPAGSSVPVTRQTVSALLGANPWVSARIAEPGGRVMSPEQLLGRSVRIP
jgi:hypothetical protein